MREELKPCPNPECGGSPDLVVENDSFAAWVRCRRCFMEGPVAETNDGATRLWNLIALPSPAPDGERLREALRFYADEKNWNLFGLADTCAIDDDQGYIARAALDRKDGE